MGVSHCLRRTLAWGVVLLLIAGGLMLWPADVQAAVPVGYDHPEADEGGPSTPQGLEWLDRVWGRRVVLAPKLPGGPLRVVALVNRTGVINAHELTRHFPLKLTIVIPTGSGGHQFKPEDFDELRQVLASGEQIEVFLLAKVDPGTIPLDLTYQILKRVKEGNSGLVTQDVAGHFNPVGLGLKPVASAKDLLPGIPYEGLQQVANAEQHKFQYGTVPYDPQPKPFTYGGVGLYEFGQGTIVSINSASTAGNAYWGTAAVISSIQTTPDMWAQNDYLYSHTAKALLKASGRAQAIQITGLQPRGLSPAIATPEIALVTPGAAFSGTLRWQLRDTWGIVTAQGKRPCQVEAQGAILALDEVKLDNGGPQYLDVWVENAAGETVDWGSTFVEVDRGATAPEIALKHADSTPRGEPLAGSVTVEEAPEGASLRVTLMDRHWREVGQVSGPANARLDFRFPIEGLEGQVWIAQADTLDRTGHILSRAFTYIRSPHTKATLGNWNPLATVVLESSPEQSAGRRLERALGFKANRAYGGWDPIEVASQVWDDLQGGPHTHVTGPGNDPTGITDYNEPAFREDMLNWYRTVTEVLAPIGLFGISLTDDSSAARELPYGAYTNLKFYSYLKELYGDFEGTCKAWGWTPPEEEVAAEDLPLNPYVQVAFHRFLEKKYGNLEEVSKAWKVKLRQFAGATQATVKAEREKGNLVPSNDVAEFKAAFQGDANTDDPFGRITRASVKAAFDAGIPGPWIDAQRFLELEWYNDIADINRASQAVLPDSWVGTDASYYGNGIAECFSLVPYVCPYYNHTALKIAVARGRMSKPGCYGVCLGSYGGKPANMSGRRGQVWDVALSGGTGLYYWILRYYALGPELTLSDAHALYQCEVIEELDGGLGEMLATCPPVFSPIALLRSQNSGLCDQLEAKEQPVTNHALSFDAFLGAMEDLTLNPWIITAEDLESGWLKRHPVKLLLLPGVNSMSEAEMEAVRAFVNGGGVVVADVLPGRRFPNGTPRAQAPLAELFGVQYTPLGKDQKAGVRGIMTGKSAPDGGELSFGEVLADVRVKAGTATALGTVEETPVLLRQQVGKGQAFLFNASFSSYSTYRAEGGDMWVPWSEVMKSTVSAAGLERPYPFTSQGKDTPGFRLMAFDNGRSTLLGVTDTGCADFGGLRRPLEITLPQASYVYDVRAGKALGKLDTLKVDLPRSGQRVYSLQPYEVRSLQVRLDKTTCGGGETVVLTAEPVIDPAGKRDLHFLRVEGFDPEGERAEMMRRVVQCPEQGPVSVPFTFAYNDQPGVWRFVVTDVSSGVSRAVRLQVKGGTR